MEKKENSTESNLDCQVPLELFYEACCKWT